MTVKRDNRSPRWRVLLTAICLATAGCKKAAPPPETQGPRYDADYLRALAVADEFCHAWRKGNFPDGRALLTPRLIRQHPEKRLADAIVGVENPVHVSYEIFDGRKIEDGRFAFQVRLFRHFAGEAKDIIDGPVQRLVVQRDEAGVWRIDEFPIP